MGWTIPGGTILAVGGFFAYSEGVSLLKIIVSGWAGSWLTLLLSYLIGFKSGDYLKKKLKQEKNAKRAELLLKKYGPAVLTTSMISNLTRFWAAYIAGAQKYYFPRFVFFSGIASLAWVSLMVIIGYLAGSGRGNIESGLTNMGIFGWILIPLLGLFIYIKTKKELDEHMGEAN